MESGGDCGEWKTACNSYNVCCNSVDNCIHPDIESTTGIYDPWLDINDDGKIDIKGLAMVAKAYGTEGTSIDKTALLLELQSRVTELETEVAALNGSELGKPDYDDSGWVSLSSNSPNWFMHNLNATNVFVYLIGWRPDMSPHQINYGFDTDQSGQQNGAAWLNLNETHIAVVRAHLDVYWFEGRIMLWKIPQP